MLSGPNVAMTKELTDKTGLNIVASGGMSSMQDLANLDEAGIKGAIIGKAVYENKINIEEAVHAYERKKCEVMFSSLKDRKSVV